MNIINQKDVNQDIIKFFSQNFFDNAMPDAQNLWMGYNDSVSSMHKDPYENIYCVVQGEKHFTLMPPDCYPFMGLNTY